MICLGCGLVMDRVAYKTFGNGIADNVSTVNIAPDSIQPKILLDHADRVLVYGNQGKSQYPGVWTFSGLLSSNRNLFEVDPNRQEDEGDYVIPEEGIHQALCGKALILSRK